MTKPKPNRDDIMGLFMRRAGQAVDKLAAGAKILYDPAGHEDKKISKAEIKAEFDKMGDKAHMFKAVHSATPGGPVAGVYQQNGLTIEVFGDDWLSVDPLTAGGKNYWDVGTEERAIIGTPDQIRAWLSEHADDYIANTLLTAQVGGRSALNRDQEMAMKFGDLDLKPHIYVSSGPFVPMARRDRYNVINPYLLGVKLMTGHVESLAMTSILAAGPDPTEMQELFRGVVEGVRTIIESGGEAFELVKKDDENLALGAPIRSVTFTSGAGGGTQITGPDGAGMIPGTESTPGVRVGDVAAAISGLIG
jgi:hypothetical protein